jgi:hypothetical protein
MAASDPNNLSLKAQLAVLAGTALSRGVEVRGARLLMIGLAAVGILCTGHPAA